MDTKVCTKCGAKRELSEFYFEAGRYKSQCKLCIIASVKTRTLKNYDKVMEYDRARKQTKARKEYDKNYRRSEAGKAVGRKWNQNNRVKYKATLEVKKALLRGDLKKSPCASCGAVDAQAHHEDYSRPLEVVWYCKRHHMDRHIELRKMGFVWDMDGKPVLAIKDGANTNERA